MRQAADTRPDWFNRIAIQRGMPADWSWFNAEVKGERPHHCFMVRGGVAGELFKRGKHKGKPNPAKRTSVAELVVTAPELEACKREWEALTGFCSECGGSGQTFKSSGPEGTTYRDCRKCKATGKVTP